MQGHTGASEPTSLNQRQGTKSFGRVAFGR